METFSIVLTNEELMLIFDALSDKRYRDVAALIDTLSMQIDSQREEKKKEKKDE